MSVFKTICTFLILEDEHLAPGLIAALTISSMFVFYFVLMMVVCLGEWYQYTHGKKGKVIEHEVIFRIT